MIHPVEVKLVRVWAERVLYALLIAGVTIAMMVALVAIYQAFFNYPPVRVESLDKSPSAPVCPGMPLHIHNRVTVEKSTILFLYVSVMDETAGYNIPGTPQALGPRPHPHPSSFEETILWEVPPLLPGKYNRTFALRGHDGDQDPIFLHLPFEIAEGCHDGQ